MAADRPTEPPDFRRLIYTAQGALAACAGALEGGNEAAAREHLMETMRALAYLHRGLNPPNP